MPHQDSTPRKKATVKRKTAKKRKSKSVDSMPPASVVKQERRWRAESDLRTIQEASEIKRDPKRIKDAKQIAREQIRALKDVAE